jgi:FkbM family methyltransferase
MDNLNLENFDWGNSSEWYKSFIGDEIFNQRIYEKFFTVDEGDIVMDVGASTGIFTYSILNNNPKHVFCVEPSFDQFPTLNKNTITGNVTCINKAISSNVGVSDTIEAYNDKELQHYTITFKKFLENYNVQKIDFIKTDCEGGEYDIFNEENMDFILNNVKKISGEWHLNTPETKEKFVIFRDKYLTRFDNFYVFSIDGVDIKWDLWNEHFLEYYNEVIISIDNR